MQGPRFALLLRKAHAVLAYGICCALGGKEKGKKESGVVGMTNEISALASFFSRTGLRRQRVGVKGPGRVSAIHRVALSCPMVIAHAPRVLTNTPEKNTTLAFPHAGRRDFFLSFYVFCNPSASLYREGGIGEEVETQLTQSPKVQWFPPTEKKSRFNDCKSPDFLPGEGRGRGGGVRKHFWQRRRGP